MKIRVVIPAVAKHFEPVALDYYSRAARPDVEISVVSLPEGPSFVGSLYEAALAAPGTVSRIAEAEAEGVDAVISDCMTDPGVEAAREVVSIPVLGPAETSFHIAAMLGHRFSVVTPIDSLVPVFHHHARRTGLQRQLASVRGVNIPSSELGNEERVLQSLIHQAATAIRDDGAHVIIFGSTGMARLTASVKQGIEREGLRGVPVIDPAILSLKIAEAFVDIGLSHSKRTYPTPPEKEIAGY
jgi:allantoin racemase